MIKLKNVRGLMIEKKKYPSGSMENKKRYMKNYFLKKPWMYHLELSRGRCKNHANYNGEKGRKLINILTKEEIEILWFRYKSWELKKPSLNRINNDLGYSFNNCEFIELSLNQSLGNRGQNQYTRKANRMICANENEILQGVENVENRKS